MSTFLKIPDTALVKKAEAAVRPLLSTSFYHHSLRTFLLGKSFASRKGIKLDEEDFYLACLFHDVGVSIDGPEPFMMKSSHQLRDFLTDQAYNPGKINLLSEAIELHMSLIPRWSSSANAGLLQVGAWMDITGLRFWALQKNIREEIKKEYPRGSVDQEFRMNLRKAGVIATVKYVLCSTGSRIQCKR